jgi:ketosteroid isomerase-like protein
MIDPERLAAWIAGYEAAWRSNDESDVAALFTADATYRTEPHADPWRGRAEIVRQWLARRDAPGETRFHWRLLASDGDLAVVQGETSYPDRTFSNLWLVRLDDRGACTEFTERWMEQPRAGT